MNPDGFSLKPDSNPETDLAYLLQHASPGDPEVLSVLQGRYAADLARLASALQASEGSPDSAENTARAREAVRRTLVDATRHLDRFWGQEGVREWLYKLLVERMLSRRSRRRLAQSFSQKLPLDAVQDTSAGNPAANPASQSVISPLLGLPPAPRLAALLRYGHNLPVRQIAAVCACSPAEAHTALAFARQRLAPQLGFQPPDGCPGWTYDQTQPSARLQERLDDLLDADPYAAAALLRHLDECPACKAEALGWPQAENRLVNAIRARWPAPSQAELHSLADETRSLLVEPDRPPLVLPWKVLTWTGLFLVALLSVVFVFNRIGTDDPPPLRLEDVPEVVAVPRRGLPTPTQFPTAQPIPDIARSKLISTFAGPNVVWSGEPSISADGHYLAFSSLADYWTPGDVNQTTDIFLYDLHSDQVERLASSSSGSQPVISGDGRYIAYIVYEETQLPEGSGLISCTTYGARNNRTLYCADLLLADQQTGQITRITRPLVDGTTLEAYTTQPTLSPDGKYLMFFSSAADLPGLDPAAPPSLCPTQNSQRNWGNVCTDLFIYEIATGVIDRLPVGRYQYITERYPALRHPPSMSAGGRYIAITLSTNDEIGPRVPVDYPTEAFVYDRETGDFIPLDITYRTQVYPDGSSSQAVISASGEYAAFVSEASNLIPGDTNGVPDVFVRGLLDGSIERVSVGPLGVEGDNPSGVFLVNHENFHERLAISGDGRYVAFVSAASNLSPEVDPSEVCWQMFNGEICSGLYLHDRLTHETRVVSHTGGTMTFQFPSLSVDGRWLAFSNSRTNCQGGYPYEVCADLLLYDVENRVTISLTRQRALNSPEGDSALLLSALETSSHIQSPPYLLPTLDRPAQLVDHAHSGRIMAVDVSPNGELLATGGDDERVLLWNAHTLEQIDALDGYGGRITAVRFDSENAWLATAAVDGTVRIWRVDELASNTPRRALSILRFAGAGEIQGMDISPSSTWLAVASPTGLWIWERSGRTFEFREDLSIPESSFTSVAFSPLEGPGGRVLVAAALDDGSVLLYDFLDNRVAARLGGHERKLNDLTFSPNGRYLATASRDQWVNLWKINPDPRLPQPTYQTSFLHPEWAAAVEFSPDSATLITTDYDSRIHYFDVASGDELQHMEIAESGSVLAMALSPGGERLFTGSVNGNLGVYDIQGSARKVDYYVETEDVRLEEQPDVDPAFGILPEDAVFNYYQNLEELADASSFEPLILETPPEGFQFTSAYHQTGPTEVLTTFYERAGEIGATGVLVLRQGGPGSGLFTYPISPGTAVLEPGISFDAPFGSGLPDQVPAELVIGEWRSVYTAASQYWAWEPGSPALHLRWQLGEREFALDYYSLLDQVDQNLSLNELVATASTLHAFSELSTRPSVDMPYLTRPGDTCSGLAARFGVEAIDLVRLNGSYQLDLIAKGCELLDPGLLMYVPVTPQEAFTADLDCKNGPERVLFLNDPEIGGMGLLLQARQPSGVYTDNTLVRVQDGSRQVMRPPALNPIPEDCGALVSTQVFTGDEPPQLLLFHWDGAHFATILDTPGELVSLEGSLERGTLRSHTLSELPAAGESPAGGETPAVGETPAPNSNCSRLSTVHHWVDGRLTEYESTIIPGDCSEPDSGETPSEVYYATANLDCTGPDERLYILPAASGRAGELQGISVYVQAASGDYVEQDRYLLDTITSHYPQLILDGHGMLSSSLQPDSCQFMVLLPLAADPATGQGEITRVLRWDGSALAVVLDAPGVLLGHASVARLDPAHFITREWRYDTSGQCTPMNVTYRWDGAAFVPTNAITMPALCTPPEAQPPP